MRPRFALLVAGQSVSQFGDKLQAMALLALVGARAQVATSGLELAKLALVFTLPMIVVAPIAGALVDRWNKVRTLIVCDTLRAVIVALLPAAYAVTDGLWTVYVLAGVAFVLGVFFNSAKLALIPELVAHNELLPANASLTLIGRFATVFGIVGGGLILSAAIWQRIGWPPYAAGFYIDAASFAFSAIMLLFIGARMLREHRPHAGRAARLTKLYPVAAIGAAFRSIRRDRALRFAFLSVALLGVMAGSSYVLLVVSVQTVLAAGTRGVGLLGGMTAAGMIVGSLAIGTVGARVEKRTIILASTTLLAIAIVVAALAYTFAALLPVAFVAGALLAPMMISQDTLVHEAAPPERRATAFATRDLVLGITFVTSAWFAGSSVALAASAGMDEPYRVMLGLCGILFALVSAIALLAHVRQVRRRSLPPPPHVRPSPTS
ncbi:MAG: MFS transporter [Gemmatimonadaceae bacterium]